MTDKTAEEKVSARVYELAYLVNPNIPEDKLAEQVSQLKNTLEKGGAFVISDEYPKFRQLAYTLVKPLGGKNEKFNSAYFGWIKFETSGETLSDVKSETDKMAQIIRYLIVKTERESKFPSKSAFWKKEAPKKETAGAGEESPVNEALIDKTIDELVVE